MDGASSSVTESNGGGRHDEILQAAASLFAEKGYQRATVKEIAARAEVAPGTIYLYFENKRDLLLSIADHLIAQSVGQVLSQPPPPDAEAYITLIIRDRLRFARENRDLLQALVTEIWTDEELQHRFITQIVTPLLVTGTRYLEKRVEEGTLRPYRVEVVLPAVVGGIVLLSVLRAMSPNSPLSELPEQELADELTQFYLYGLQAEPGKEAG